MANLPPRPTFTNLGDGAPMYSGRRRSSNHSEALGGWNSSNPRYYHPYDHRQSTPTQGPPCLIPPWRRDGSHSNSRFGLSGHHGSRPGMTSFASRSGKFTSSSAVNTSSSPARQQTVYQSGPVMYSAGYVTPEAVASSPHPVNVSSPQHFASPDSSVGVWTGGTGNTNFHAGISRNRSGWNTSHSAAGSGYSSGSVPTSQTSSPSPDQGEHWQHVPRRVSEVSVASSGCYPFQSSHPTSGGTWRDFESIVGKSVPSLLEGGEATSSSYSAATTAYLRSRSSFGAVGAGPVSASVDTSPAPNSTASGFTHPGSTSPIVESICKDRPSSTQTGPKYTVPSTPSSVSPPLPSPSATGFLMNDRTLYSALSAAADQPAPTAETTLGTVCAVAQRSNTRNSGRPTPEENVLIQTESKICMAEETSHNISRSASNHTSPTPPTPAGETSPSSPPSPQPGLDENTNHHPLPPLRPSPSASPPPIRPELLPIPLTPHPDTTLHLTLGPSTRVFLITSDMLRNFTAWGTDTTTTNTNTASSFWSEDDTDTNNTLHVNLTSLLLPLLAHPTITPPRCTTSNPNFNCGEDENENELHLHLHLDALHALLRAMHSPAQEGELINIARLWRLSRLHAAGGLGLKQEWLNWLRRTCMGGFVARLGGVRGWLAGYRGYETNTHPLGEECEGVGEGEGEGLLLEKAVSVCGVFGWAEEGRRVMGRLAYVCALEEEEEGDEGLVKPDGGKVEQGVCGQGVVDAILAARRRVVEEAFGIAQKSLCDWTMRVGRRPCANMTCNANRIAALNVFLLASGLYPRGRFSRSLHEVVRGLQYITSTDAELMTISIERGEPFGAVDEKLAWAARIRDMYGGACTKCNEKAATSMLFPLEDLLCDLTFEMDDRLLESVEFPAV